METIDLHAFEATVATFRGPRDVRIVAESEPRARAALDRLGAPIISGPVMVDECVDVREVADYA